MRFLFRPIKRNFRSRGKVGIKYLVIHDTGNVNRGAGALNHRNYVENNERGASAHYFVDDKVIVQYVGDSLAAGSVGDGKGRFGITNSNSLSIEMCINSDGNYLKMYKNTVELTKNLMKKFNIPWERVVRHYDASRKNCPGHMSKNNWEKWKKFKEDIKKPIEWEIDLSKDSEFGVNKIMEKDYKGHWAEKAIDEVKEAGIMKGYEDGSFKPDEKITRAEVAVIVSKLLKKKLKNTKYYQKGNFHVIETDPLNIRIEFVAGRKMSELRRKFAINGTFFDTKNPSSKKGIWKIAVQDNLPLGENSFTNSYQGTKTGTMVCFEGGRVIMDRFNNLSEIQKLGKVKWAIGGNSIYPDYNLKIEKALPDLSRFAPHTMMAYTKDDKILLLITKENRTLTDARNDLLKEFSLVSAINLDGGGSTAMVANGKIIKDQGRRLNTIINVM